jgi:hypothetical protein
MLTRCMQATSRTTTTSAPQLTVEQDVNLASLTGTSQPLPTSEPAPNNFLFPFGGYRISIQLFDDQLDASARSTRRRRDSGVQQSSFGPGFSVDMKIAGRPSVAAAAQAKQSSLVATPSPFPSGEYPPGDDYVWGQNVYLTINYPCSSGGNSLFLTEITLSPTEFSDGFFPYYVEPSANYSGFVGCLLQEPITAGPNAGQCRIFAMVSDNTPADTDRRIGFIDFNIALAVAPEPQLVWCPPLGNFIPGIGWRDLDWFETHD